MDEVIGSTEKTTLLDKLKSVKQDILQEKDNGEGRKTKGLKMKQT